MKIGLFDSGLGGLTILKAVVKELPQYNYSFYGDTQNLPYGDKSEDEIYQMTVEGMRYLFNDGCALVIIACNTASAETARRLQNEFLPAEYPDRKILGIIVPTVETLVSDGQGKVILLATKRTVESNKYQLELDKKEANKVELVQVAAPELVPLIEHNELAAAAEASIKLIDAKGGESEVVVLGCTHYTQIKKALRENYGDKKKIISQDEVIPRKLRAYIDKHPEIEARLIHGGERKVHLTKHRPDYDVLMGQFLGGVYVEEE